LLGVSARKKKNKTGVQRSVWGKGGRGREKKGGGEVIEWFVVYCNSIQSCILDWGGKGVRSKSWGGEEEKKKGEKGGEGTPFGVLSALSCTNRPDVNEGGEGKSSKKGGNTRGREKRKEEKGKKRT